MNPQDAYKFALLVINLWRESRGEPFEGKLAVANVIRNRVNSSKFKQWGLGWDGVILHPFQFSSFNKPQKDKDGAWSFDPNAFIIPKLDDPSMADCIKAAELVFTGKAIDNTQGATYYYALSIDPPEWAKDYVHTVTIGNHKFFREG